MNIRNRTQSDVTVGSRRKWQVGESSKLAGQVRSKDEFDVARTLANFSETAINFETDHPRSSSSQIGSSVEREKTLNKLAHDRRSVICENHQTATGCQDADMDTDDDIDVEGIDDPLADIEGVNDEMETDPPDQSRKEPESHVDVVEVSHFP